LLLITLVLWPLGAYSDGALAVWGTIYLTAIGLIGWFGGINWLNRQSDKTTAFNLVAVIGVVVVFVFYNIPEWLGGRWKLGSTDVSIMTDDLRKIIGLFAMVQGFEAARHVGNRFSAKQRISLMRVARYISSFAFYFLLQALIADMPAWRKQAWGAVAGFTAIGLAMAAISVFGISI
jgi:uncharacterized membrane protein